jgi:phosphate transport system protein
MWSLRSLERISDRAQNICEYVVYYVSGENIRHKKIQRD